MRPQGRRKLPTRDTNSRVYRVQLRTTSQKHTRAHQNFFLFHLRCILPVNAGLILRQFRTHTPTRTHSQMCRTVRNVHNARHSLQDKFKLETCALTETRARNSAGFVLKPSHNRQETSKTSIFQTRPMLARFRDSGKWGGGQIH